MFGLPGARKACGAAGTEAGAAAVPSELRTPLRADLSGNSPGRLTCRRALIACCGLFLKGAQDHDSIFFGTSVDRKGLRARCEPENPAARCCLSNTRNHKFLSHVTLFQHMIAAGITILLLIVLCALFPLWPGRSAAVDSGMLRAGSDAALRAQSIWQSPPVAAGAVGAARTGILLAVEQMQVRSDLMPDGYPSANLCDAAGPTGSGGFGLC